MLHFLQNLPNVLSENPQSGAIFVIFFWLIFLPILFEGEEQSGN